ncbi:TerB family tellurite resistance protein [Cyanobacterium sp. Dongsha4]|uniref:TerB family tellurite resistance protein n=1 Tax=Cyanobacterium sp. DS4 TaxID=2878255 RepID=UPI002E8066C3|nr:TerB family tellurite resistance protein [Cyanobacterium sp. Dongsha4]WVK99175.1 tellurite resistance TerB family protein [Cyanobacterium sp. Dongsha4]
MSDNPSLFLPESQLLILNIVCALAWADDELSEEETEILLEKFKSNLPPEPEPIYFDDPDPFYNTMGLSSFSVAEQTQARINAEIAFKDILNRYKQNPIPLSDLVSQLKTNEDRCLAAKLAYMVIKASPDNEGNLICPDEKAVYRQLIQLLNLDPEVVQKIEQRADYELDKFQHPFKAFMGNVKKFFLKKII